MHLYINVHSQSLIDDYPGYVVKAITTLQSQCVNMIFAEKIRYNRQFWKVVHKVGESEIKYINIFHTDKALAVSVGNSYFEDQLMHTFLEIFQQGGEYSAQIASHQA